MSIRQDYQKIRRYDSVKAKEFIVASLLTVPLYCEHISVCSKSSVETVYVIFWPFARSFAYHGETINLISVGHDFCSPHPIINYAVKNGFKHMMLMHW